MLASEGCSQVDPIMCDGQFWQSLLGYHSLLCCSCRQDTSLTPPSLEVEKTER